MEVRFVPALLAGVAALSIGAGTASAGGRFTLIEDAACATSASVSQGFVWWSGKDPALAVYTFQPSGQAREQVITRFMKMADDVNYADFGIFNSTSVDIELFDRRGNSLASVSGVPCTVIP